MATADLLEFREKPLTVRRKSNRSALWLALHGWLGLPIWAFIFFVCLTGSLATMSEEIIWLINPAARATAPAGDAHKLSYDQIIARVKAQQPEAHVSALSIPVKDIFAWHVRIDRPGGNFVLLYVNPYTGDIQGEIAGFDLRQFLRALHGWLLVPFTNIHSLGWYVVSAVSIPLLGSLITGLIVYKKFWRAFLAPRLRLSAGSRIFWGDLHRLLGLWSIPFILIMSITGLWFFIQAALEDTGRRMPGDPRKPLEHPHVARRHVPIGPTREDIPRIGVDQAVRIASERFSDFEPAFIFLPAGAYDPLEVSGRSAYPLVFETAYFDPYSGKVLGTRGLHTMSTTSTVVQSMRPLHTGDFAGLWLKLLYLAFGLILTAMSLSGMLIWAKRSFHATGKALAARRASQRSRPYGHTAVTLWRRGWFHLSAVAVVVPALLVAPYIETERAFSTGKPADQRQIDVRVGRWDILLQEEASLEPAWDPEAHKFGKWFNAVPCAVCRREIRALYLSFNRPGSTEYGSQFEFSYYQPQAQLLIPEKATGSGAIVWITAEGWDGTIAQASMPLAHASPTAAVWLTRK